MFTMTDFENFQNGMTDAETLDVAFSDDGKIRVNGKFASKRVTEFLMTSPLMRSVVEMAIYQFDDPAHPKITKAVRKLLRKYA